MSNAAQDVGVTEEIASPSYQKDYASSDKGQELTAMKTPLSHAEKLESSLSSNPTTMPLIAPNAQSQTKPTDKSLELSIDDAIELIGMGKFQYRILVAAGLCLSCDAIEVSLLSFLQVILQIQWNLSDTQAATITSMVFIGQILGALVLGSLGDRIGRKPASTMTALIICSFGFATAFTSTLGWLILFRSVVGFGVGGFTIPFDMLSEFLPNANRGTTLLLIEYFCTGGSVLVPLLAMITLGPADTIISKENQWRCFVSLCAIPCLVSSIGLFLYVPESPRWLLTAGKHDEAIEVLRYAARCNNKDASRLFPPNIRLYNEEEEDKNCLELLSPTWRRTSILLWLLWGSFAFCYYGAILAVTNVFAGKGDDGDNGDGSYSFDYFAILASASAEIAGVTSVILSVDSVGRVPSQVASYIGGGISVFLLCAFAGQASAPRLILISFSFLVRMFFMGATCVSWISTAEILTTDVRSTGHSTANAVARLSAAMSPYLVTKDSSWMACGLVVMGTSALSALASGSLPETRGQNIGLKRPENVDSVVPSSYIV